MPVRPNRGPDGTRPSTGSIPATAVAVAAACARDSRRAHELCALRVNERQVPCHRDLRVHLWPTGHAHGSRCDGKNRLLRASDSVKRPLVASTEDLNTRSMHIQTPVSSLPATAGSHVRRAILSRAPRMKRHISARARIGLRGGERVGVGTVSTTVARSFNVDARSRSQVKVLVDHQAGSPSKRIY